MKNERGEQGFKVTRHRDRIALRHQLTVIYEKEEESPIKGIAIYQPSRSRGAASG